MEWRYATSGTASCQAKGAARSSCPGAGSSKQKPEFIRAGVRRVGQPPHSQRYSRKTFSSPPAHDQNQSGNISSTRPGAPGAGGVYPDPVRAPGAFDFTSRDSLRIFTFNF